MKKWIALALSLLMLTSGVALAGTIPVAPIELTDDLTLVFVIPETVSDVHVEDSYDMKVITFDMSDQTLPEYTMLISYSEELGDRDITELEDSELKTLVDYTAADSIGITHSYEVVEMEDGWPGVLVVYEGTDVDEGDWVDAFTVIEGYIIQVHGAHEDFSELTDAEDQLAFTLLDSVDIVTMTD